MLFSLAADNPCGRADEERKEIDYISSVREKVTRLSVQFSVDEFSKRVTHNDIK